MNKLAAMSAFLAAAELGGFTPAARRLGVQTAAAAKNVAKLEDELGVLLITRSPRHFALTAAGAAYALECRQMLAQLEAAETAIRSDHAALRGKVRAISPVAFARLTLVPRLAEFQAAHPDIELDLTLTDRVTDFVETGYDLLIRRGRLRDSRLRTRLLTRGPLVTVAAPAYLARRGPPQRPEDLRGHDCLLETSEARWKFRGRDGRQKRLEVSGRLRIVGGDGYREAACAGLGVAQSTFWLFRQDLREKRVTRLLEGYEAEADP
ncbi:MAG TPA: LysR substrate-binding domain-containing protein, partial [Beijerinckiaceae bacterium]